MNFKLHLLIGLGVATAIAVQLTPTFLKDIFPIPIPPVPCQVPTACSENSGSTIVSIFQANSPEAADLVKNFLYQLGRKVKPGQRLVLHRLKGQQVEALYSNNFNARRDLNELHSQLESVPSDDQALVQGFQIAKEEAIKNMGVRPIDIFIVSEGTSNPASLKEINYICSKIAEANVPKLHLHLIGLAPDKRILMANAIQPMGKHARSAGTGDSEWLQILNDLK